MIASKDLGTVIFQEGAVGDLSFVLEPSFCHRTEFMIGTTIALSRKSAMMYSVVLVSLFACIRTAHNARSKC